MLIPNEKRTKKSLTQPKKLALLRDLPDPVLWSYYRVTGLTHEPPNAIWQYTATEEEFGAEFGIRKFRQNDHWLDRGDILDHLTHRLKIVAVLRYLDEDGLIIVQVLIFDLDAKNPEQAARQSEVLAFLNEVLIGPRLLFRSSFSGGLYLHLPVHTGTHYSREYEPDAVDALAPGETEILEIDGKAVTGDTMMRQVDTVRDLLGQLGLLHGDVELFPAHGKPLRLPLGPGSYLVGEDGFPIEHPGDALQAIHEFHLRHSGMYPTLPEVIAALERHVQEGRRFETSVPRSGPAVEIRPGNDSPEWDAETLYNHGLQGPHTRNDAVMLVARWIWGNNPGTSPEECGRLTANWLSEKHNGFSDLVDNDPNEAWNQAYRTGVAWGRKCKSPSGWMANTSPGEAALLHEGDLLWILAVVEPPPPEVAYASTKYRKALEFFVDLLGFVKWQVGRTGDLHAKEHPRVDVPRDRWLAMKGCSKNREDGPSYYRARQAMLRDLGLLTPRPDLPTRGQSKSFIVRYAFATDGPPLADPHAYILDLAAHYQPPAPLPPYLLASRKITGTHLYREGAAESGSSEILRQLMGGGGGGGGR